MNNEIIEYKENIITKSKKFFKRLFRKSEKQYSDIQEKKVNEIKKIKQKLQKREFINNIKADTKAINSVIEKRKFLEKIDGNEKVLNLLSIDRLRIIEKYYDSIIEENDKKIKKLQMTE